MPLPRSAAVYISTATLASASALSWTQLPPLPDREGFAGSFAGALGDVLFVAGGANFPDKRPWEGGTKTWYDRVFLLERGAAAWRDAGRLPSANGYGATVAIDDRLLLIGGGDAVRNFAETWLVSRRDGRIHYTAWPALPRPLAQFSAARVGRKIYVAGGLDRPDATVAQPLFAVLDLDAVAAGWRDLPTWPGSERFLATAGGDDDAFYLFSGARLVPGNDGKPVRAWLRDAYRYSPTAGWKRLADLPAVSVAAPTPAPHVDGRLLVLGGDDGAQVAAEPTAHRGFPRRILAYDPHRDTWTQAGEVPFSLVTTAVAEWDGAFIVPGGEARPGVRSPLVWRATTR